MTYFNTASITLCLLALSSGCSDDAPADTNETTGTSAPDTSSASSSGTTDDTPTSTSGQPVTTGGETDTGSETTEAGTSSTSGGSTSDETSTGTTGEQPGWSPPNCEGVMGTGAVTFSHDEGATLAPMDQVITPVTYTFGLVTLGEPGAMLAGSGEQILASDDAGCTWHSIGEAGGGNTPAVRLVAAGETRAYGFGDNDGVLVRVDDEVITKLGAPVVDIVGLGVDPEDPDHVRIGDFGGQLWDSTDAGVKFSPVGVSVVDAAAYRFAFDPHDVDHILVGALGEGVLTSLDGGATWQAATGLGSGHVNGFNVVVSPADGDVVWVEGLDLDDPNDATARHIWRSDDGGLSFAVAVDSDDATLYNGNHLFAHPTETDVLYFVFGSNFQGYGTDIYRYDHAGGTITTTHHMWHDTVLAFLPGDPTWMYLGLSIEPGGG